MPAKQHLTALDGLRGLTAIIVTAFHAGYYFRLPILQHGYLGVDFFFLLSGFVVALAYERTVEAGRWLLFTRKRFIRLFPMIAFGAAWGALLLDRSAPSALKTALLIPTMSAALVFPINSPIWSMLFEAVANGLYGAMGRTTTRLWVFLAGVSAMAVLTFGLLANSLNVGFQPANILLGLPRTLAPFLIGVVIYRYKDRVRLSAPAWVFCLLLVGAFALPYMGRFNGLLDPLLTLIVFPAILLMALACREPPSWVQKLCRLAGEVSYPLYLIHWPLLVFLAPWVVRVGLLERIGALALAMLALPILAFLVLRLYEEPARRLLGLTDGRIFPAKLALA